MKELTIKEIKKPNISQLIGEELRLTLEIIHQWLQNLSTGADSVVLVSSL